MFESFPEARTLFFISPTVLCLFLLQPFGLGRMVDLVWGSSPKADSASRGLQAALKALEKDPGFSGESIFGSAGEAGEQQSKVVVLEDADEAFDHMQHLVEHVR